MRRKGAVAVPMQGTPPPSFMPFAKAPCYHNRLSTLSVQHHHALPGADCGAGLHADIAYNAGMGCQ